MLLFAHNFCVAYVNIGVWISSKEKNAIFLNSIHIHHYKLNEIEESTCLVSERSAVT